MRADAARLIVLFVFGAVAAGCQSGPRWDWWHSAKNTTPSNSALAKSPYQPSLPSAAAQSPAPARPAAGGAGPYSGLASYPATNYPATNPGGATLSSTATANGYPVAGGRATAPPSWPPAGASPATPYPNTGYPATGSNLAATPPPAISTPPTTRPQIVYPPATAANGLAPQAGPYSGSYPDTSNAMAKASASESAAGSRYAGDSSTGDRYASNPHASTRYDVTAASPPDHSAAAETQDRYGQPASADRYDPKAAYVGSPPPRADRYAQQPGGAASASAAVPPLSASALPPINTATADRYGSGVEAEPAPGVGRYVVPSSDPYPHAKAPAAGNPADNSQNPSDEYTPGSIKRYTPPADPTTIDLSGSTPAATDAHYPPANSYPPAGSYPQTATPGAPGYYSAPAMR